MTRLVERLKGDSLLVGELPRGCQLCAKGTKMVLFVTGLCDSACFYCPLSEEKSGKDIVFADEMKVETDQDILFETEAIGGEGAGISGGDPLCNLDRTVRYITLLKSSQGNEFHTHLYTSQSEVEEDILLELRNAGLDEIRFHPQSRDWSGIETAVSLGMVVGLELPAIPGQEKDLESAAEKAEAFGVDFLNINELEASETNFAKLAALGLRLTSLDAASIEGSRETAENILHWAASNLVNLSVHFCTAVFKDRVQLRNRLERRLVRTIRAFEEKDEDDPLLILGLIRPQHGQTMAPEHLGQIYNILRVEFNVPHDMMNLDFDRSRIEIAPWILEEIAEDLRIELEELSTVEMGIAYEYPSWDRLQTLFDPL
ncbi:MAG: radical SAM protein [Candidatus Thorarchaeota archaeon]|nr:MAG: radical SAM protein [Candidatus Thorarchaeota archaeon]